jgi:hypothetical protein
MRVTQRVESVAIKTGKSTSTVWRWAKAGCDLSSSASINQFLKGSHHKRNGVRTAEPETSSNDQAESDLPPLGRRGAAAALQRLEQTEERAFARLSRAIEAGNPFQVKAAQEFYLRSSEVLRRLDAAVECERRKTGELVSKQSVENVAQQISEWLRTALCNSLVPNPPL